MTFNDWSNYETWCVFGWMTDSQENDTFWTELTQKIYNSIKQDADKHFTKKEHASFALAEHLQDYFEENAPNRAVCGCYIDLIDAALSRVNWMEIATDLLSQVKETNDD